MKDLWMYLLPSGFIASFLTWIINRRREQLNDFKDEHTVYRELYEDLKELIRKQAVEQGNLRRKIYRLEQIMATIGDCQFRHQCPLLQQLPLDTIRFADKDEHIDDKSTAEDNPTT